MTHCPDCTLEGRIPRPEPIWDDKHGGHVCPECRRVFAPGHNPKNFHYTERKFMLARMKKDQAVRRMHDAVESAVRERWTKNDGFALDKKGLRF